VDSVVAAVDTAGETGSSPEAAGLSRSKGEQGVFVPADAAIILGRMTIPQLRTILVDGGISYPSSADKKQLIRLVHEAGASPKAPEGRRAARQTRQPPKSSPRSRTGDVGLGQATNIMECCKTRFKNPDDLFEHSKVHLWRTASAAMDPGIDKASSQKSNLRSDFSYGELRSNQIRLLEVLTPDRKNGMLRFQVTHVSLDESAKRNYVALSYCWGHNSRTVHVLLGNALVEISETIECALRELISRGCQTLWVDRLCICQTDLAEKESQILKMWMIFRNASNVVVWLGNASDGSDKVMDLMAQATRRLPGSFNENYLVDGGATTDEIQHFFARQYWSRTWIIQECVAAKNIGIYCGKKRVSWTQLQRFVEDWTRCAATAGNEQASFADLEVVSRLIMARENRLDRQAVTLLQALQYHRFSVATKAHDKVFALLGLTYDSGQFVTSPHYAWSLRELCLELTRHFIRESGSSPLDIIFAAQRSKSPLDLPSWCPDYLHVGGAQFSERLLAYLARQDVRHRLGRRTDKWSATSIQTVVDEEEERQTDDFNGAFKRAVDFRGGISFGRNTVFATGLYLGRITNVDVASPYLTDASDEEYWGHRSLSSAPTSDSQVFDSLSRLFMLYDRNFQKWAQTPEALKYLFGAQAWRMMDSFDKDRGAVRAWLKTMQDFRVFGKTVKQRADSSRLHRYGNMIRGVFNEDSQAMWIRDYSSVASALDDLRAEGLVLMTTGLGRIGWVQDSALIGDEVYLLQGCSMPVVLRSDRPHKDTRPRRHSVVGYSLVDQCMDGTYWKSLSMQLRATPHSGSDRDEWLWRATHPAEPWLEKVEIV
jgi:hypothetical protein